jgi:hypothetical protein
VTDDVATAPAVSLTTCVTAAAPAREESAMAGSGDVAAQADQDAAAPGRAPGRCGRPVCA